MFRKPTKADIIAGLREMAAAVSSIRQYHPELRMKIGNSRKYVNAL